MDTCKSCGCVYEAKRCPVCDLKENIDKVLVNKIRNLKQTGRL